MTRPIALLAALALAAGVGQAYIRIELRPGVPYYQADPENVVYLVDPDTTPGMRNRQGRLIITTDSSPTAAIAAALERWSGIAGSRLRFAEPRPARDGISRLDNINIITFADDPFNRAIVGGAIAVTRLTSDDGRFTDTDIVFNAGMLYSTTQAAGTFDIEGTLTHELGHAIGLDHSGVVTATMFATAVRGSRRLRTLTEDDRAFAREVYPSDPAQPSGVISGTIRTSGGSPVNGALLSAVELDRNIVIGTIAEADGRYRFGWLPPGEYALAVEPLNGPTFVGQLQPSRGGALSPFPTQIPGGAATPGRIPVEPSGEAVRDFTLEDGPAPYNILGLALTPEEGDVVTRAGVVVDRGGVYPVQMHGEDLDAAEITEGSLFFLGSGVSVVPDSFGRDTVTLPGGNGTFPRIHFEIFVAPAAPYGAVSVGVATEQGMSLLSGGIEIEAAAPQPVFSMESMVSAASFFGGGVAPGEILTIFGAGLGPDEPELGRFDTVTGGLRTELDETAVFFQQTPAPLYFTSPGQINLQVPIEVSPGSSALVRIVRQGVASDLVTVPVRGESPGVFTLDGLAAVAVNQDGSLNGPAAPAARGSLVTLYATGQGLTNPALKTGEPAPVDPLSRVDGAVEVSAGGRPAEVLFAGMTPGLVGLLQLNIQLAADAATGPAQPLALRIRGAEAAPATLAIE